MREPECALPASIRIHEGPPTRDPARAAVFPRLYAACTPTRAPTCCSCGARGSPTLDLEMEREDVDGERARALVAWLELHAGSTCARCDRPVCRHELLFASALGFRAPPWCSTCAAKEIGQSDAGALRRHLRAHFARRS